MNQEQAKEWLPLIQAVADGKTIQGNYGTDDKPNWKDVARLNFDCEVEAYRIKPEPKKGWYRVGLLKTDEGEFFTTTADSTDPYEDPEQTYLDEWSEDFVRWLTDRIEYELPEGEA
jgi:hypothetical protein